MTLPQSQLPEPGTGRDTGRLAGLTTSQKITIGIIAGGVFIALVLLMVMNSGGDMAILYSNLSPEDAGRVIEYLKESGTKYKLTSGGHTISVAAGRVYELRMELASKGVPQGAGTGFELFDKTSFGATEFTQKVNYARALQGELARSIMSLNPVEQARVHIVIPEERLFSDQQKPTTASIVLSLKPGSYVLDAQVRGIVNLVAGAVQGLTPDNITVVDTDGNLLWRGGGAASGQAGISSVMTTAQLEAKMAFEQEMQRRIESMLDRALGLGKAVVRVYADINFDQTERASEIYQPAANGRGIPIAEQITEERRTDDGSTLGGIAGTPTNLQGYPIGTGQSVAGGTYARSDSTINYEVSKIVEKAVTAPGKVERISVATMVDGVLTEDRIESIKQVISAAAGIRAERGDQVTVSSMEFAKAPTDGMEEADAELIRVERQAFIMKLVKVMTPIILGILILVFALSFLKVLRSGRQSEPDPAVGHRVDELLADGEGPPALRSERTVDALGPEEKQRLETRQNVETLAKTKPQDAARLLETWMSED